MAKRATVRVIKRVQQLGGKKDEKIIIEMDGEPVSVETLASKLEFYRHEDLYKRVGVEKELAKELDWHPSDDNFSNHCEGFTRFMKFLKKEPTVKDVAEVLVNAYNGLIQLPVRQKEEVLFSSVVDIEDDFIDDDNDFEE